MSDPINKHEADFQMVRSLREMLGNASISMDLLEMRYPHLAESCARVRGAVSELNTRLSEMNKQ